jgi:hypothetical protein
MDVDKVDYLALIDLIGDQLNHLDVPNRVIEDLRELVHERGKTHTTLYRIKRILVREPRAAEEQLEAVAHEIAQWEGE